ncbi:hypothetical protein ACQP1V_43290 (plasmid) [Microtetraspora malaysiensis]|uniref:hypothetical protein n=1 Tax=Microtetraspora malaysiensis TaxID=161358 RepID=UPI003D8B279D
MLDIKQYEPVHAVVEAVQVTPSNVAEVAGWIGQHGQNAVVVGVPAKVGLSGAYVDIETREGMARAMIGDWVVRDGAGEFYPLLTSVFPRRLQEYQEPEEPGGV